MTDYKNQEGVYEKLTKPKVFYCTFHHEYAYNLALKMNTIQILGTDVTLEQATEPTDIVWENQQIRPWNVRMRWCIIIFVMALLTFGGFTLIVWLLKKKILISFVKNPPGIDCDQVIQNYGDTEDLT